MNQLEMIARIVDTHERNANDDNGDKYLSSADYAMEAISDVLAGLDSPILRTFLES